jgi:endogenous inhibitor of DNA gyrase (YacG/DUF329 family)
VLAYTPAATVNHEYIIPVYVPATYTFYNAGLLENWISVRETWEQESPESEAMSVPFEKVDLGEWISERETWEQGSEPENTAVETVNLEEWVSGREAWEQEGNPAEISKLSNHADILKAWISKMDNWEQK